MQLSPAVVCHYLSTFSACLLAWWLERFYAVALKLVDDLSVICSGYLLDDGWFLTKDI